MEISPTWIDSVKAEAGIDGFDYMDRSTLMPEEPFKLMNNADFYLSSSDYVGFDVPRATCVIKEVLIPVFSGKGLLVEIFPPPIGQPYGFGNDDIHRVVLTPRFDKISLTAIKEWPCHVHILCSSIEVNGDDLSNPENILNLGWGEINQVKTEVNHENESGGR